jgi:hypothetical protein
MNKQAENVKTDEKAVALSGFECVTKFIDENLECRICPGMCRRTGESDGLWQAGKESDHLIELTF